MKPFNVIYESNGEFLPYDIMPYLVEQHKKIKRNKPKTYEEIQKFIKSNSMYQWWARCEYEIILRDWPCQRLEEKWDIYKQVLMNIDVITDVFIENIKSNKKQK